MKNFINMHVRSSADALTGVSLSILVGLFVPGCACQHQVKMRKSRCRTMLPINLLTSSFYYQPYRVRPSLGVNSREGVNAQEM